MLVVVVCGGGAFSPGARADFNLKPMAQLFADVQLGCDILLSRRIRSQQQDVLASSDLLVFSRSTALEGFAERLGVRDGVVPEDFSALSKFKQNEIKAQPWFAASIPIESYRLAAYEHIRTQRAHEHLKEFSGFTGSTASALQKAIDWESQRQPQIPYSDQDLYLLCGSTGKLLEVEACVRSLKAILKEMMPINGSNYVLMEETGKFLLQPLNVRGVARAAAKISKIVDQGLGERSDLFSVLQESFVEVGLDPSQAYDNAWTFMGIYSASGANVGARVKGMITSHGNYSAEGVGEMFSKLFTEVALGSVVLDSRYLQEFGGFFSFPKQVVSQIENAKAYHFWAAAYWARKNTLRFASPGASAHAAWLSHLGYQINSNTTGRDPARAFFTPAFGTANNKIRLDLAYAANGAHFGSQSVQRLSEHSYDVNQTLQALLREGEDLKPLSVEQASKLVEQNSVYTWLRWKRIFAPESAMKAANRARSFN